MRVSGTEPGVMTGSEYFFHELSETTLLLHYYIAMCGSNFSKTDFAKLIFLLSKKIFLKIFSEQE